MLSVAVMLINLSVTMHYAECRYDECHHAECCTNTSELLTRLS
jgi:hypothetical protein